jgi:hypothetical protein
MTSQLSATMIAYGFALTFAMLIGGFIAFLLWVEHSRPSTIALGAGGAAVAFMTIAVAVLDHLLAQ